GAADKRLQWRHIPAAIVSRDGIRVLPSVEKTPMNPLESQLDYPFGDALPASGSTFDVAPGIKWLRMALPFALNHINLWLLEDEMETDAGTQRGWTVVDCGIASDATRDAWEDIFAAQLDGLPVLRVIATHCHPDHVGLADWI